MASLATRPSETKRITIHQEEDKPSLTLKSNFIDFCETTSMHGWFFLNRECLQATSYCPSVCLIYWTIVVASALSCGILFFVTIVKDYQAEKTSTDYVFGKGNWQDVEFPSITLCNKNQVRRSFLEYHKLIDFGSPFITTSDVSKLIGYIYGQHGAVGSQADYETILNRQIARHCFDKTDGVFKTVIDDTEFDPNKCIYYNFTLKDSIALQASLNVCVQMSRLTSYRDLREKTKLRLSDEGVLQTTECPLFNMTIDSFRIAAAQSPFETNILGASYQGIMKSIDGLANIQPVFETDFGFCSYIRPSLSFLTQDREVFSDVIDRSKTSRSRNESSIKLGIENGLELLLDAETYDQGWSFSFTEGFRIGVNHREDYPFMEKSTLDISPGFNSKIVIEPTLKITTDQALKFSIPDRKCYKQNEAKLSFLPRSKFRYSQPNCVMEGVYTNIRDKCHCHRGISPDLYNEAEYPVWSKPSTESSIVLPAVTEGFPQCSGDHMECYENELAKYGFISAINRGRDREETICYPTCSDQTFQVTSTVSKFPNLNSLERDKHLYCLVFRKIRAICSTAVADGIKRRLLELRYGQSAIRFCNEFNKTSAISGLFTYKETAEEKVSFGKNKFFGEPFFAGVCRTCTPLVLEETVAENDSLIPKNCIAEGSNGGFEQDYNPPNCVTQGNGTDIQCERLKSYFRSFVYRYATDNLVKVDIFLRDTNVDVIEVGEKQPIIWLLANIGGQAGLVTGMSIITVCEIFFFTMRWLCYKFGFWFCRKEVSDKHVRFQDATILGDEHKEKRRKARPKKRLRYRKLRVAGLGPLGKHRRRRRR